MNFAVFTCTVLLVAGAQASSWTAKIEEIQVKVENVIDSAIKDVTETVQLAESKAKEVGENLKKKTDEYTAKMTSQTQSVLKETNKKVADMAAGAGKVNVDECVAMSSGLERFAKDAVSNMSACAQRRLVRGQGYVDVLLKLGDKMVANLTSIREDSKHCSDNVDDIKSAAQAIVCSDVAAAKAVWATAKGVPAVTTNAAKLTYLLSTLHLSLPHCTNSHGYSAFLHETVNVLRKVKKCVDEKVDAHEEKMQHEDMDHEHMDHDHQDGASAKASADAGSAHAEAGAKVEAKKQ